MAMYCYFSFGQLKLHNPYNVSYSNHCTKAVVLPAIVVEKNYKQSQRHYLMIMVVVHNKADSKKFSTDSMNPFNL